MKRNLLERSLMELSFEDIYENQNLCNSDNLEVLSKNQSSLVIAKGGQITKVRR